MSVVVAGFVDRPEGWAALDGAIREARLRGAQLLVVHSGACEPALREGIATHIAAAAAASGDADLTWELQVLNVGNQPVEDLVSVVEEHAAQLLVIGIRRRSSVGKFVMGSDAQRILMLAQCPVLAVKAPAAATSRG